MDSPGQDNSESYHKDKSESFRRCERGKFFMIFDNALPAQNIMDDIDRTDAGSPGMQIAAVLPAVASRVRPGWESDPKTDEFIKRPPDLQDAGDDV